MLDSLTPVCYTAFKSREEKMDNLIFAEFTNEHLAEAINRYLDCDCWTAADVEEWREDYIEKGFMVGYRTFGSGDSPVIEGSEHSNFTFVCWLEDTYFPIW
jgi:hypothetical protein